MQEGYVFEGQRPDELVLSLFRKHKLWLIKPGLWWLIATVLLILAMNWPVWLMPGVALWLLISFNLARQWALWYHSFLLITNQRLRYVQRFGLFKQTIVDLKISSLQTVMLQSNNLLSDLFKYGDLLISAESGDLSVTKLEKAARAYNLIQDLINKERS